MRTRRRCASPNTTRWSTHSRRICADHSFRKTVLPRRTGRDWLVANAHGTQAAGDYCTINRVTITDPSLPGPTCSPR